MKTLENLREKTVALLGPYFRELSVKAKLSKDFFTLRMEGISNDGVVVVSKRVAAVSEESVDYEKFGESCLDEFEYQFLESRVCTETSEHDLLEIYFNEKIRRCVKGALDGGASICGKERKAVVKMGALVGESEWVCSEISARLGAKSLTKTQAIRISRAVFALLEAKVNIYHEEQ